MGMVLVWEDEKFPEIDGSNGRTIIRMCLMPLKYILGSGSNGKFHALYILPHEHTHMHTNLNTSDTAIINLII